MDVPRLHCRLALSQGSGAPPRLTWSPRPCGTGKSAIAEASEISVEVETTLGDELYDLTVLCILP